MKNHEAAWMPLNRPLNLQLFADPEPANTEGGAQNQTEGQQPATLTMEDVMRIVQSESDKRVTQAVNKVRREYEKQMSLSGLDEQARKDKEKDERIEELTNSLRQSQLERNHLELVRTLAGRGIPVEFADLIDVGENLEEAQKRIDALDNAFKKAVEDAVNKRIAGKTPAKGSVMNNLTREDIMKIDDPTKRQAAIAENIELFR